jgi:hypothetical protein
MKNTINKTWFKNRLKEGKLLVKCCGRYTDDYAFDASNNFGKTDGFVVATAKKFDDWYIGVSRISGAKDGIIEMDFASCEYFEFKLA